jgi:endogenous inhibitor of DNA gyrase (YacG/DUF329 family)
MKVQIKYPKAKCPICGKTYTKHHNRQIYCSPECSKEARQKQKRDWAYKYYHKNKNRINHTRIGTRTIGPRPNPNTEREHEIIQNEIERIGLHIF